MNQKLMLVLLVLGVVLIVAAGVTYVVFMRETGPAKPPEVEMPPSLEEWAEKYPRLEDVLNNSELGSAYKEFLAVYEEEGEAAAMELARERGILVTDGGEEYVYLILILDTEEHEPVVAEMEAYGARVFSAHQDRVSVGVPVEMVKQQLGTEDPGAIFEDLTGFEHVIAVRLPEPMIPNGSEIDGEGVDVIDADAWHAAGITGAGLQIAILDGGFFGYQDLLGEELPDSVVFQSFGPDRTGDMPDAAKIHGAACAEIVHEVAPDAELFLVRFGDSTSWAEALDWIVGQGVDIVSHSWGWSVGYRDGTSWHAEHVDDLVDAHGILWVNAAGNDALSHYSAQFTDNDGDGFHDFAPNENLMAIPNYGSVFVALQWEDNWDAPTQDFEFHAYDQDGNWLASSTDPQTGTSGQYPVEVIQGSTGGDTLYVAVEAHDVDGAVTFDIYAPKARVEYPVFERSLGIPADARTALSVGAVNWYDDSLAEYSSQGPTADGRFKPEISAPTDVSNASYGDLGVGFTGTSAACPHIAGAAALVWQANPDYTYRETIDFLLASVVDLGPDGPDTGFGYGRLQLPAEMVGPIVESTDVPVPTGVAGATAVPDPSATLAPNTPEPVPTEPVFVRPTAVAPPPVDGSGGTGALLVGVTLIVGVLGCGGVALLFVGVIGLIVLGSRRRRARPVPQPPRPMPYVPPPQPMPQPPVQPQAVNCPHCGATVRADARFCSGCGKPMAPVRQCTRCGAALAEGVRFCAKCGQPV